MFGEPDLERYPRISAARKAAVRRCANSAPTKASSSMALPFPAEPSNNARTAEFWKYNADPAYDKGEMSHVFPHEVYVDKNGTSNVQT